MRARSPTLSRPSAFAAGKDFSGSGSPRPPGTAIAPVRCRRGGVARRRTGRAPPQHRCREALDCRRISALERLKRLMLDAPGRRRRRARGAGRRCAGDVERLERALPRAVQVAPRLVVTRELDQRGDDVRTGLRRARPAFRREAGRERIQDHRRRCIDRLGDREQRFVGVERSLQARGAPAGLVRLRPVLLRDGGARLREQPRGAGRGCRAMRRSSAP